VTVISFLKDHFFVMCAAGNLEDSVSQQGVSLSPLGIDPMVAENESKVIQEETGSSDLSWNNFSFST
jgi:hypothetical protein